MPDEVNTLDVSLAPETPVVDATSDTEVLESTEVTDAGEGQDGADEVDAGGSSTQTEAQTVPAYLSDAMKIAGWTPEEVAEHVKTVGLERAVHEFKVFAADVGNQSRQTPKTEAAKPGEWALNVPDLKEDLDEIAKDYPELAPALQKMMEKHTKALQEQLKPFVGSAQQGQQASIEQARAQEEKAVHAYLDGKTGYAEVFGTTEKMNRAQAEARRQTYQRAVAFKQADPTLSPQEALDMAAVHMAQRLAPDTGKRDQAIKQRSAQRRIAPASGGRGGEPTDPDDWSAAEAAANRIWRQRKG